MNAEHAEMLFAPRDGRNFTNRLQSAAKRIGRTALAAGEVAIAGWPAMHVAVTAHVENVYNVTVSPFGVLSESTSGSAETLAIGAVVFLALPIWRGYEVGKRWGIFTKPSNSPQA